MASTITRSQSKRAPLGCGGTGDSHKYISLYSLLHVDIDSIYSSQTQKEVWAKRPEIKSDLHRERERTVEYNKCVVSLWLLHHTLVKPFFTAAELFHHHWLFPHFAKEPKAIEPAQKNIHPRTHSLTFSCILLHTLPTNTTSIYYYPNTVSTGTMTQ